MEKPLQIKSGFFVFMNFIFWYSIAFILCLLGNYLMPNYSNKSKLLH